MYNYYFLIHIAPSVYMELYTEPEDRICPEGLLYREKGRKGIVLVAYPIFHLGLESPTWGYLVLHQIVEPAQI